MEPSEPPPRLNEEADVPTCLEESVNSRHPRGEKEESHHVDAAKEELKDKINPDTSASKSELRESDMEVEAPRRPPQEAPSSSTSSSTERKDLDKNKETQQSKAEDANTAHMERKSESSSHRRKDSKDGARSSHEPPAPTPQEERAREENEESNPCPRHDRPPSTSVAATQTEA